MANKFRNEMDIKLGRESITLRPSFESIAAMESDIGSCAYLAWKYSRGLGVKDEAARLEAQVKAYPSMSETAKIIFYNQAPVKPEGPNEKSFTLEEIFEMVLAEGVKVCQLVPAFIAKCTAGNKLNEIEEVTETQKKS